MNVQEQGSIENSQKKSFSSPSPPDAPKKTAKNHELFQINIQKFFVKINSQRKTGLNLKKFLL